MAKFHINSNGGITPCKAKSDQSCPYGKGDVNNHFDNLSDAGKELERRLEAEYKTETKMIKKQEQQPVTEVEKKRLAAEKRRATKEAKAQHQAEERAKTRKKLSQGKFPEVTTMDDLDSVPFEEAAQVRIFDYMKRQENLDEAGSLQIGYPINTYGAVNFSTAKNEWGAQITPEETEKVHLAYDAFELKGKKVPGLLKEGWKIELVEDSLKDSEAFSYDDHPYSTGSYSETDDDDEETSKYTEYYERGLRDNRVNHYTTAEAVFTNPKGEKCVLPVGTRATVDEIAFEVAKEMNPKFGTHDDPTSIAEYGKRVVDY